MFGEIMYKGIQQPKKTDCKDNIQGSHLWRLCPEGLVDFVPRICLMGVVVLLLAKCWFFGKRGGAD